MVYFVATLHPNLGKYNKPDYNGPWLSDLEQKQQIDTFYNEKQGIPLSYDHLNCGTSAYVPREDVIGQVVDLFQGDNGNLMVKCFLSPDHPASYKINRDVIENKIRWGVSVGLIHLTPESADEKVRKKLVHVAFTTDPGFAAENTFLHYWAETESKLDYVIGREYFKGTDGKSYANENLVRKIRGIIYCYFVVVKYFVLYFDSIITNHYLSYCSYRITSYV